jgi:hypothetical protein
VTWIEILQAVLLGLVVASLALFTWDRRCEAASERAALTQIFSNPHDLFRPNPNITPAP